MDGAWQKLLLLFFITPDGSTKTNMQRHSSKKLKIHKAKKNN